MAQKREKPDETLELKVPTEAPLSISSSSSCPDNCKIAGNPNLGGPDPGRIDRGNSEKAGPSSRRSRSQKLRQESEDPAGTSASEEGKDSGDVPAAKKALNRCCGCGKRVGLTGFRCRCGDLFCSEHRYSDRHDCSFDYKAAGREAIARENPVVRAAKILKV